MKKKNEYNKKSLYLDKLTLIKLDEAQLHAIVGGDTTPASSCIMFSCNPDNCLNAEQNNNNK